MLPDLIIRSILFGFSFYSIIYLIYLATKTKWKEQEIKSIDRSACIMFAISGIMFLATSIWHVYWTLEKMKTEPGTDFFMNRFIGGLWMIWLQPALYFIISQLMWIPKLRRAIWLRSLVILIMLLPTERIIILITALHRDYLPTSWRLVTAHILVAWITYILVFTITLTLFHLLMQIGKKKLIQ